VAAAARAGPTRIDCVLSDLGLPGVFGLIGSVNGAQRTEGDCVRRVAVERRRPRA
jgi:hypothetical protein